MRVTKRLIIAVVVVVASLTATATSGTAAGGAAGGTAGGTADAALGTTVRTAGGQVTIVRDEYGVPHVYAASLYPLFYGDGYATGQERLFQADLVRRTATGTLSALIGAGTDNANLGSDIFFRHYSGGTANLRYLASQLDPTSSTALNGFVAGINAWIATAERTGQLPLEYLGLHTQPQPWTVADVLATGMLSTLDVGATGADELANAAQLQAFDTTLGPVGGLKAFDDVHWLDDRSAPTTVPATKRPSSGSDSTAVTGGRVAAPALSPAVRAATASSAGATGARAEALLRSARAAMARLGLGGPGHSNAIAISGRLSATGHPLLLGGPQVGYSVPQSFVEVGLSGAGFDTTGVALAGLPGIEIGVGPGRAWTVTTGGDDNQDFYVELTDPTRHPGRYFFDGSWRRYRCSDESITVAGGPTVPIQLCTSVHGPVFAASGDNAISLRDATRERVDHTLRAFLDIDRARSFTSFITAAREIGGSFNLTTADTAGHIAYAHVGPVPIRARGDNPFLPHPGDGTDEWRGFVPASKLPLVMDPAQGWLANWNNKPQAGWSNSTAGFWSWGPVQRVQAIDRQMRAVKPHSATLATLEAINRTVGQTATAPPGDNDAVYTPALLGPMLAAVRTSADPRLRSIVALLRGWNQLMVDPHNTGRYASPAVTVFTAWYSALVNGVFVPALGADFAPGGPYEDVSANLVSRLLAGPAAGLPLHGDYTGGVPVTTIVTKALVSALNQLTSQYKTSKVAAWLTPDQTITWSPLGAGTVPATPYMNRGTYNQVVSLLPAGIRGVNVVAPGESGDPRSPYFADQLSLYATWHYKPMRLTRKSLAGHTSSVTVLTVPLPS